MLYYAYQLHMDVFDPLRLAASGAARLMEAFSGADAVGGWRRVQAACEILSRARFTHVRPEFGIDSIVIDGEPVSVTEEKVAVTPFASLIRFRKSHASNGNGVVNPRLLVVAPLSGHFATLLKATIKTLLQDHDVYVTDWHNARDVAVSDGNFGFSEYVDHVIHFLEVIGPGAHVLAVCQPCVQVLAAAAVMAEDDNPACPRSMTLMAGPVDVRVNPSKVNELATSHPLSWFDTNLIETVPLGFRGMGRRVYPGFTQLTAFLSMNLERHGKAHESLYHHLVNGEVDEARTIKDFYDEYCAVLDLTAEFYLETLDIVFQRALLAQGKLFHHGRLVNPAAIRRTALLTVEGERDDICSLGQTAAAHDLCTSIKPFMKRHHMQTGVGHYGVFSGRKWEGQVYPLVRNLIVSTN